MTAVQTPALANEAGAPSTGHRVPGVPLTRLTLVELRKLADTRAGLWLLVVIALASVATGLIMLFATPDDEQTFRGFFGFAQLPAGILLPVLGILSMTGEWTQRTALTTFTLVPQRGKVIAAKLLAAVVIAILATGSTAAFAAVFNLVAGVTGGDAGWDIAGSVILQCLVLQVLFVLMGAGFGALLHNSPVAIVAFFALPMLWTILGSTIRSLQTAAGWLDINTTTGPLTDVAMTGDQWSRLGVSAAVWVLLPLILGTWRVLRREVN